MNRQRVPTDQCPAGVRQNELRNRLCRMICLAVLLLGKAGNALAWPPAGDTSNPIRHRIYATTVIAPAKLLNGELQRLEFVARSRASVFLRLSNSDEGSGGSGQTIEFSTDTGMLQAAIVPSAATRVPARTLEMPLPANGFRVTELLSVSEAADGSVWGLIQTEDSRNVKCLRIFHQQAGENSCRDIGEIVVRDEPDPTAEVKTQLGDLHKPILERFADREYSAAIYATSDSEAWVAVLWKTSGTPSLTLHRLQRPRLAGVTTVYRKNSHADVIMGRILEGDLLNGSGTYAPLRIVSMHADQTPPGDISHSLSEIHHYSWHETVAGALRNGSDELSVDGVLLVAEHGTYETSPTGQTVYPKRRLFDEVVDNMVAARRTVPVFIDKHLADNWQDAKHIYDMATRHNIPLMAGSSLPSAWRVPEADVRHGAALREIVGVSYGRLDSYGFHGMEMLQCLAERRAGGETGVRQVHCLTGDAVWNAIDSGAISSELYNAAIARLTIRRWEQRGRSVRDSVKEPVAFVVTYRDGLQSSLLTLNGAVAEWSAAWKYGAPAGSDDPAGAPALDEDAETVQAALFQVQEVRPFLHFAHLVTGIETLMQTRQAPWPVERTLLTSGMLDAALLSKVRGGETVDTPWLDVRYSSAWHWRQPPPMIQPLASGQ